MKIFWFTVACIIGHSCCVYSAQDSAMFAKKAALIAKQSALNKAMANDQSPPPAPSSQQSSPASTAPSPQSIVPSALPGAASSEVRQSQPVTFTVKDSTVKAPIAPTPMSQPAKTVSTGKNTSVEEEDMLIDETEVKKHPIKNIHDKNQAIGSSANDTSGAQNAEVELPDSQKTSSQSGDHGAASQNISAAMDTSAVKSVSQPEKPIVPAAIESIHSINFAKNQKDYRSPKIAMLLSLLVPGLGQAYVKQYYKTGIFVALEATAIGFSVAFNNKGKKQYDDAKTFADHNYDNANMTQYYSDLYNFFLTGPGQGMSEDSAHEKMVGIYSDTSFLHSTSKSYTDIQSNSFVQGWKDCEPKGKTILQSTDSVIIVGQHIYRKDTTPGSTYLVYQVDKNGKWDTTKTLYGYSTSQNQYNAMVSKSNSYYKTAQSILFTLLINHIISAVDALISAKAYNSALLGRETLWQHLSIQQQFVDVSPSLSAGVAMRVSF